MRFLIGVLSFTLVFVAISTSLCTLGFAQTGKASNIWQWTDSAEHHNSVVTIKTKIEGSSVNDYQSPESGVLIEVDKNKKVANGYRGFVLTAYHLVEDAEKNGIKVKYRNKRQGAEKCSVYVFDKENDLAILWVWVPEGINPAKIASAPAKFGDFLEFAGVGGNSSLSLPRTFQANASQPSTNIKIFADTTLLEKDSGGPIFNKDNELVGIISGGWFWWDAKIKDSRGNFARSTWPAKACNLQPIKALIEKANEKRNPTQTLVKEENK